MQSKNKPAPTAAERRHVARVKQTACAVCDQPPPVEAHEPEQGLWMCSIGLCPDCHRGPQGWHGDRRRWKDRKMFTEVQALNVTLSRVASPVPLAELADHQG